jgi:hypothetical protein
MKKKHTPGQYLRTKDFVYALDMDKSGANVNRWSCRIDASPTIKPPQEEIEAVAALFAGSPRLFNACVAARDFLSTRKDASVVVHIIDDALMAATNSNKE